MSKPAPGWLERAHRYAQQPAGRALLATLAALAVLLALWWQAAQWYRARLLDQRRAQVSIEVSLRSDALAGAINQRVALLHGFHAFVQAQDDLTTGFAPKFEQFAAEMYAGSTNIRNLSVAPGGVIAYVYPLEGNEDIRGYEPIHDPRPGVAEDVARAIETGQVVLTGPMELMQGGDGLIAYQAVERDGAYWGLVTLVLDLTPTLAEANLNASSSGLQFALRDSRGYVFHGPRQAFLEQPVIYRVALPGTAWELAGVPVGGWAASVQQQVLGFQITGLSIVLLLASLVYLATNRQESLASAVYQRTRELMNMSDELRRSEALYRAVAHNFPDGAVAVYDKDLRFTIADGAALATIGLSKEQVEGRTYRSLLPERASDQIEPYLRSALQGEAATVEASFRGREFLLHTLPLRDEWGAIYAGMAMLHDITERKRAEAALHESVAQYRGVFDTVNDGLFINTLEGRLVAFNPAAARMHGYTPEEFAKLQPADFIDADSMPVFETYMERVRQGGSYRAQAVDVRKDGTRFYIEVIGTPFRYMGEPAALGVVRDITQEVAAYQLLEQRVAERTRELAALLNISQSLASTLELRPLLDLILDHLKEVVDYTCVDLFICEADEVVLLRERPGRAHAFPARFRVADYPITQAALQSSVPLILSDMRADPEGVARLRAGAAAYPSAEIGSWLSVPMLVKERAVGLLRLVHSQPGYYSEDQARLAMAFANQAAVAIENARLYEQGQQLAALEERQKLARELHDSVSQALYGIALGARTARALLDRHPAAEPVRPALGSPLDYVLSLAEAGLAEMRALIFELRPESLESEGLLAALTKQADSLRARHNLDVQTDFGEEPAAPLPVKEALYRIAQEALHNVAKHARASQVTLRVQQNNGQLVLQVSDNGQGFDPSGDFPGHLGLRSMRERAEKFSGRFAVTSAPGAGTQIEVGIPVKVEVVKDES